MNKSVFFTRSVLKWPHKVFSSFISISIVFGIFGISGCQNVNNSASACPGKPSSTLNSKRVQEIQLSSAKISKSDAVAGGESVGYTFKAKKKQSFNYQVENPDICIWIFDPDNKIVANSNLPQDGKYLAQIENRRGAGSFKIEMSLNDFNKPNLIVAATNTPSPNPLPSKPTVVQTPQPKPGDSPKDVITQYYEKINSRDYKSAWNRLPIDLRDNRTVHPNGYQSFTDFYDGLNGININSLDVVEKSEYNAEVRLRASCKLKSNKLSGLFLRFHLKWNDSSQQWEIYKVRLDPNEKTVCG
jgi:hypothetical protein